MRLSSKLALATGGAVLLALAAVSVVPAQAAASSASTPSERRREVRTEQDARQLERCKAREGRVASLMSRMSSRGEKQLALIDQTSKHVQDFYTQHNLTVAGYATALAETQTKQAAAKAAVEAAKAAKPAFACDGNQRKIVQNYQKLVSRQNDVLTDYRDAVKKLVQLVKVSARANSPAAAP